MLGACLNIFYDLDAFFHHELQDFKVHWVQLAVFEPLFLHAFSFLEKIFESFFFVREFRLDLIDLLADLVDFFVNDFDLNVGVALFLDN